MTHDLKIWPEYFAAILDGSKTFEVRADDRDYVVGDLLRLREWSPVAQEYTGREVTRRATYVLTSDSLGVRLNYVVLALSDPLRDAAAELLAALEVAADMGDHSPRCGVPHSDCDCWQSTASAVIAKARGVTP